QPGAGACRLGALVAPVALDGVFRADQLVAVLANLARQALAAVARRRAVVVDVNGFHARLGRRLQVALAVAGRRLRLARIDAGRAVGTVLLAVIAAHPGAAADALAGGFLGAEAANHGSPSILACGALPHAKINNACRSCGRGPSAVPRPGAGRALPGR